MKNTIGAGGKNTSAFLTRDGFWLFMGLNDVLVKKTNRFTPVEL
jgi:hypothetical protein